MHRVRNFVFALVWLAFSALAVASPYRGVVTFGGLPLPGATVTATQGTKILTAVSDQNGAFAFDNLADGKWTITVAMQCFNTMHADITVAPKLPAAAWEMKLQPVNQLMAHAHPATSEMEIAAAPQTEQTKKSGQAGQSAVVEIPKAPEENQQSADGFLAQGSVDNAATSVYSTNTAFGNKRPGARGLYTGGFVATIENSALDAQQYSLTGSPSAKPNFSDFTGVAILQGPLRIPRLMPVGPNFSLEYTWTRDSTSQIIPGLVPTQAERSGTVPGFVNPFTVSPQAAALLTLYPLPNLSSGTAYNYQLPVVNGTHEDALNSRLDKRFGRKDYLYGGFAFQSTRANNIANIFDFVDHTGMLGITGNIHWQHSLKPRMFLYTGYTFSRSRTELTPNFEGRENISGNANITGNDQDSADWGPPALTFSSGLSGLSDSNSAFNRIRTDDFTASTLMYHSRHTVTIGGEFNKQEYNWDSQQNPRGTFQFTTVGNPFTTGSDLADFLVGNPAGSSIAYGNANKYFRDPVYAAYFNDDWRVLPILSINWGVRWDYGAPMTELFGNLVNLDVANGFTAVAPVLGSDPVGPLTGQHYPSSLIRPDRTMFEPKIGVSWRPIPASTIVIRAGYGLYPDTSVYQNIVLDMAQQPSLPHTTSYNVQNSECSLSLATFTLPQTCSAATADTYGIDPNFRIGYAQDWKLEVQRDLPFAMQGTVTYLGSKGTHGPQLILPNSYPLGAANPCPSCPSGFEYETSGGNSIRNAAQLELRRRLRSGFAASLTYTYAKSIDDDAYMGGQGHTSGGSIPTLNTPSGSIAQNWLDPQAERSLSNFDQRNLLSATAQYTSGQGLEGGTLLGGWRGRALKEWTLLGNVSYGSGLPETPVYSAFVPGTEVANVIRPDLTGAPVYGSGNTHFNAAAFTEPAGQWGAVGRNSLTGPGQLSFNSSLARVFRPTGKTSLNFEIISTNPLNHPSFSSWNNNINNAQFGLPSGEPTMRSLQIKMFWRFQ